MQTVQEYARPNVTVDVVMLTMVDNALSVFLLRRAAEPHRGALALLGGYIHVDKDISPVDAALRVLRDKANIRPPYMEQLRTFGGPDRDPRGWSISVSYVAVMPLTDLAGAEEREYEIHSVDALPPLPFDHAEIIAAAVERIRNKASYSSLPCFLLDKEFTFSDLLQVYEAVLNVRPNREGGAKPIDQSSFRRKMLESGVVVPVKGRFRAGSSRPAQIYRMADRDTLWDFQRTIAA